MRADVAEMFNSLSVEYASGRVAFSTSRAQIGWPAEHQPRVDRIQ